MRFNVFLKLHGFMCAILSVCVRMDVCEVTLFNLFAVVSSSTCNARPAIRCWLYSLPASPPSLTGGVCSCVLKANELFLPRERFLKRFNMENDSTESSSTLLTKVRSL